MYRQIVCFILVKIKVFFWKKSEFITKNHFLRGTIDKLDIFVVKTSLRGYFYVYFINVLIHGNDHNIGGLLLNKMIVRILQVTFSLVKN